MSEFTMRPRRPEDDQRLVEIENALRPYDVPRTVEEFRHYNDPSHNPEGALIEHLVAERDGLVLGALRLRTMWWVEEPGGLNAYIFVDRRYWGDGVGSRLYDALRARGDELEVNRVYTRVCEDEPRCMEFARQRGFAPTGHVDRISRLDVHTANFEGYDGLEERLHTEGIRIATLAEAGTGEDFMRKLHRVDFESARDVPHEEEIAPIPFDLWRRELMEAPGLSPEWAWVALHGEEPVGAAYLQRHGEKAADNDYTGVARAYRGRGIARALKRRTIEWARQNGVDYIYTGNDVNNTRMLDINTRLGFQPLPGQVMLCKRL